MLHPRERREPIEAEERARVAVGEHALAVRGSGEGRDPDAGLAGARELRPRRRPRELRLLGFEPLALPEVDEPAVAEVVRGDLVRRAVEAPGPRDHVERARVVLPRERRAEEISEAVQRQE